MAITKSHQIEPKRGQLLERGDKSPDGSEDRGSLCQGVWEGVWVMVGLCHGSKQSPGRAFSHFCVAKVDAQSPGQCGFQHGKEQLEMRVKARAKLLVAAGSGCPQLLPWVLPAHAPKPLAAKGDLALAVGRTPGLCSASQLGDRAGIK